MERVPFGTDRLTVGEDGIVRLSCRHEKPGWIARRPADLVHKEFPGTCVRWGEDYFEVVDIEVMPVGVRYTLTPWSESHTMRTVSDYDEASEAGRAREREEERQRQQQANRFAVGAIFYGLLPEEAQVERQNRLGISPVLATLISAAFWASLGALCLLAVVTMAMNSRRGIIPENPIPWIPPVVYYVGVLVLFESAIRFMWSFTNGEAVGSFPVVLGWEILQVVTGKKSATGASSKPKLRWELDAATIDRDAFVQREPFLALLSPDEQRALERRYGFDWARHGRSSAIVLLLFAAFVLAVTLTGIARGTWSFGDLVTTGIMIALGGEQISRLGRISAGEPAGSVLGSFIRPFSRKLFE